ncbi:MAG: VCBS repeat-containing protein, partial [Planctomycetes bacterium]|nr:VCBS repeat-containing protein [Planctomycetota bacterium]
GDGRDDVFDYRSRSLDYTGISFVRTPFPTVRVDFSFLGGGSFTQHAIGDFDGDGDLDIVLEDTSSFTPPAWIENLGNGNFRDVSATRMPTARIRLTDWPIVPTDFDSDGDLDLLVFDTWTPGLSVMVNQGGGVFAAPDPTPFAGVTAQSLLGQADVDQDGDLDLWIDGARLVLDQGTSYALAAVQPLPTRNQA